MDINLELPFIKESSKHKPNRYLYTTADYAVTPQLPLAAYPTTLPKLTIPVSPLKYIRSASMHQNRYSFSYSANIVR